MKRTLLMMAAAFCDTVAAYEYQLDANDIGIDDETGNALTAIARELRAIATADQNKGTPTKS